MFITHILTGRVQLEQSKNYDSIYKNIKINNFFNTRVLCFYLSCNIKVWGKKSQRKSTESVVNL